MARVKNSLFSLSGSLGDLVFVDGVQRTYVRRKGSLDKQRVITDEAFANSRKGMNQFRFDNSLRTLIKNQCVPFTKPGTDPTLLKRLSGRIKMIRDCDISVSMGSKSVFNPKIGLFNGFEFNTKYPLNHILDAKTTVNQNESSSTKSVSLTLDIAPAKGWMPVSMDGFLIYVILFSFDQDYTLIESNRYSSPVNTDQNNVVRFEHSMEIKNQPKSITMCAIGVQTVYGNQHDYEGTYASYGIRGHLLVL